MIPHTCANQLAIREIINRIPSRLSKQKILLDYGLCQFIRDYHREGLREREEIKYHNGTKFRRGEMRRRWDDDESQRMTRFIDTLTRQVESSTNCFPIDGFYKCLVIHGNRRIILTCCLALNAITSRFEWTIKKPKLSHKFNDQASALCCSFFHCFVCGSLIITLIFLNCISLKNEDEPSIINYTLL